MGTKIIYAILLILFLLVIVSCMKSNNRKDKVARLEKIMNRIEVINGFVRDSFVEYEDVYIAAEKHFNYCRKNNFKRYAIFNNYKWFIDSLIIQNQDKDKCVGIVATYKENDNSYIDLINYFYGVKLSDGWKFFKGDSNVLFRNNYHYDRYIPLSKEELSFIARLSYLNQAFVIPEDNQFLPNEAFFERKLSNLVLNGNRPTDLDIDTLVNRIIKKEQSTIVEPSGPTIFDPPNPSRHIEYKKIPDRKLEIIQLLTAYGIYADTIIPEHTYKRKIK